MKIAIDNLDGHGALDYTACMAGKSPLTIERKLNKPTMCKLELALDGGLTAPVSGARVRLTSDSGALLFTGYVGTTPSRGFAGMETAGPVYTLSVSCTSDEFALNARVSGRTTECVAMTAGSLLTKITGRAGSPNLPIRGDGLSLTVGGYQALAGKSWSENVGALANATRASYRVLDSAVQFLNVEDTVHTFSESDGNFDPGALQGSRERAMVSDITVCGKVEPQTYVTEIFQGDGVTSVFDLSEAPLEERGTVLSDTFSGSTVNSDTWSVVDDGGRVSLTSHGLTLASGAGTSSPCIVSGVDEIEMGGVILIELSGLSIDGTGEGYLAGLTAGGLDSGNLVAGFRARVSGSSTVIVPMVLGNEAGASYTIQAGHTYTLRLRFHCRDRQRVLQSYSAGGANGAVRLGGQNLTAGADLVMEIQETTGGSFFSAVVLYDGAIQQAPQSCTPVVIDSTSLTGSIASFLLKRPGDVWVSCVVAGDSGAATQRLGVTAQSAQAKVSSTGRLSFYSGNIPATGTLIHVVYRLSGHAVARMASTVTTSAGNLIVTAEHPSTRSSADCENAALTLLSSSTWAEGSWKGTYTCWNPQQTSDIWPGDLLQINAPNAGISAGLLARTVKIEASLCAPELLKYSVEFANDWAEKFSITVKSGAPTQTWLPTVALNSAAALACVRDLAISNLSKTEIAVQAGITPPSGGGFEVRRSDWKFGAGDGADLVLRSPTPEFTIIREASVERYYVRMFDGAAPPNYSRFSSALFVSASM